jgi:hypothetical protein
MSTRKAFRALTVSVVEKRFLGPDEAMPEGWHETPAQALEAFGAYPAPTITVQSGPEVPVKRSPDRHRKGR